MRTCVCCCLKLLSSWLTAVMNDALANSGALATTASLTISFFTWPQRFSELHSAVSGVISLVGRFHSGLFLDEACCPKFHLTGLRRRNTRSMCSSSDGWRDLPVEQRLGLTTHTDGHGDFLSFSD